ncbi:MAG TPA: alkaline phosphatase family protein [Mycobacterium sp.]|nr:alkaline phosphatase family protein [Mycobacterium sp.]
MRRPRRRTTTPFAALARMALIAALAVAAVLPPAPERHFAETRPAIALAAGAVPTPAHVVIVVEENRSQANIIGNSAAPFINQLAAAGAMMSQSFAETHPSEPNYFALFAGSTFGITQNVCPVDGGNTPNLGSQLLASGRTFMGFAEGLPAVGSTACTAGAYGRKHAPWVNFTNIPPTYSVPFSVFPSPSRPQGYNGLPTVSFVIPDGNNDMHDGSIAQGDNWLKQNLFEYAKWAKDNNSLLILTWDEDDNTPRNQIPTIIYGAGVKPGSYAEPISHYNVLSTLEEMYGLPKLGLAARAPAITDIWGA